MESIEQMIKRLCPKGVEWKKISEIAYYPKVRINTETLSVDTYVGVESLIKDRGGKTSSSSLPEGVAIEFLPQDILIGNIRPYLKKIWLSDCQGGTNGDVICIRVLDSKEVIPKYLYHNLASDKFFDYDNSHAKGGKMPRGDKNAILAYKIPLPPLEIQSRIVEVLDKMATLTAELEAELKAELEARKQQYEYYRGKLLTFNEIGGGNRQVYWKKISEICVLKEAKAIKASELSDIKDSEHQYPCYGGNGIRGYIAKYSHEGRYAIIGRQGALCGCVNWVEGKFYATEHAVVCTPKTLSDTRFLYFLFTNENLNRYKSQGAQPGLSVANLYNIMLPIPPLSEQQRVVSILDRFEALTTDLQIGLPAEIEARRQQYEYYRNKLLTFEAV